MATMTATSSIAAINGIELGYQVFGTGDPLILLHGGFGSMEMFGPNVDALAAGRRVIGVDLQSHGRSPAADRPIGEWRQVGTNLSSISVLEDGDLFLAANDLQPEENSRAWKISVRVRIP